MLSGTLFIQPLVHVGLYKRGREHYSLIVPNIALFVLYCSVVRVVFFNLEYFAQSL
jgi:hypothetical protein